MAPEQPAGWSKRPSSAAAGCEEAKAYSVSVRRASKRGENKAGRPFGHAQGILFQHPARSGPHFLLLNSKVL